VGDVIIVDVEVVGVTTDSRVDMTYDCENAEVVSTGGVTIVAVLLYNSELDVAMGKVDAEVVEELSRGTAVDVEP
jgi:hypothetical protein